MRVAVIVEYLHERGGTQRQALALARALEDLGHQAIVFTREFDKSRCFPELNGGLKIRAVRTITEPKETALGARPLLAGLRAPILRTLDYVGGTYLRQCRAMMKASDELTSLIALEMEGIDVLNPHDFGPSAWASASLSRRFGKPSVWQCNDPLYRWDSPRSAWARVARAAVLREDRRRTKELQDVTVLDTKVALAVGERYGVTAKVVRSGVDALRLAQLPERAGARRAFALPERARVITVLTLLTSPHRRVEDAIAAHAQLPADTWLHIVAPFDESMAGYPAVVARAAKSSPARDRIVWTARRLSSEDELRSVYAASDVYLFPNVNQTWGLAAIEAAAAGIPLVVSDGAGAHEVFTDGTDALVYRGGDANSLTAALARLAANPDEARRMATRAQDMVRARFGWENYAKAMLTVFEQACARRASDSLRGTRTCAG
jgi:glycosyltransferase involved in cell wall biosynthesis